MSCINISVSIVAYASSPRDLLLTLESLAKAIRYAKDRSVVKLARFFLVDNGPDVFHYNFLLEVSKKYFMVDVFDDLTLVSGHGNIGFGRGHNLAVAASNEEFHLILNPDVLIDPEALSCGLKYLLDRPPVVMVSPRARWSNGSPQYLCKRYPSVLTLAVRGFLPNLLHRFFKNRLSDYEMRDICRDKPVEGIPIVSGCFMLVRKKAFEEVGGFSKDFFMYFEDFDLSLRIQDVGLIAYLPAMKIIHMGGNAAAKGVRHIKMFIKSAFCFYNRHGWKFY